MTDAHRGAVIAYSTIAGIASGRANPRVSTLRALEAWSRRAGAPHGVHISAARTLEALSEAAA